MNLEHAKKYFYFILSLTLIQLSYPPFNINFFGWISLVPFFVWMASDQSKVRDGLVFGTLVGINIYTFLILFDLNVYFKIIVYLLIILITGMTFALYSYLLKFIDKKVATKHKQILLKALVWMVLEYGLSKILYNFQFSTGFSQYKNSDIISLVKIVGIYGLSFIVVLVNLLLTECYLAIKNRDKSYIRIILITVASVVIIMCLGNFTLKHYDQAQEVDYINMAFIQANISSQDEKNAQSDPLLVKGIFQKYLDLSKQATLQEECELIVWPEGAVNRWAMRIPEYRESLYKFAFENQVYLLFGVPDLTEDGLEYNSAFLISPNGTLIGRYDKNILVPYTERFFEPGEELNLMKIKSINVGVQICFEGILENYSQLVKKGADVVFVLSSYGYFGYSSAHYLSAAMTRIRAVENNVPVVQVIKSGISQIINSNGVVLIESELNKESVIHYKLQIKRVNKTLFSKFGNIFYGFLAIITLLLILYLHFYKFLRFEGTLKTQKNRRCKH